MFNQAAVANPCQQFIMLQKPAVIQMPITERIARRWSPRAIESNRWLG